MARDYARNGSKSGKSRSRTNTRRRRTPAETSPPWAWFLGGLFCGVILSGLLWLAWQQPPAAPPGTGEAQLEPEEQRPQPSFDFYTLLPEQRIDIGLDPESIATATPDQPRDQYLLQAGSFQRPEDADRRRAELLLLGLDARVEEASGDNGRWFRVYIGPFDSRSRLASARSLTAQQGIDTLLLKRPAGKAP
jgi:cell division protein FtsN